MLVYFIDFLQYYWYFNSVSDIKNYSKIALKNGIYISEIPFTDLVKKSVRILSAIYSFNSCLIIAS